MLQPALNGPGAPSGWGGRAEDVGKQSPAPMGLRVAGGFAGLHGTPAQGESPTWLRSP